MKTPWVVIVVKSIVPLYQMMAQSEWEQSGEGFKGVCDVLGVFDTESAANAFFQSKVQRPVSSGAVD